MMDFLAEMANSSRARADRAGSFTAADFDKPLVPLRLESFEVIAEIKSRSPADGALSTKDFDRVGQAQRYVNGGAIAISVLTEPDRFDGSLDHLEEVVAAAPGVPVMRKDFLVDPVQVLEARKAGASGVLLIAAMLDDAALRGLLDCAFEHGLFVLLEAFDESDLDRCRELLASDGERAMAGQLLFGVNTRDLRTLKVDPERLRRLAAALPPAYCVAESGLKTADDAERAAEWGYQLALVGGALMQSADPAALIAGMRAAGSRGMVA